MACHLFAALSSEVLQNPVVFWYVVSLGVFIIAIIILTNVKWITGKVLAAHPAETCLRQEQGFIYLTSETRKGGENFSHVFPSSADSYTSLSLANTHPLCTFVPGSPIPSNPSCLVHLGVRNLSWNAWGAAGGAVQLRCAQGTAQLCPRQEEEQLRLKGAPRHSPPAPRLCYQRCWQPPSLTPHFLRNHCLEKPSSMARHPFLAQKEEVDFQTDLAFLLLLEVAVSCRGMEEAQDSASKILEIWGS